MIAQDPLSLVFIFCFLLGFGFFLVTAILGSHGHNHGHGSAHAGGHAHAGAHTGGHAHAGGHVQASGHAHSGSHAQTGSYAQNRSDTMAHVPIQAAGHQADMPGHFSLFAYLNPMSIALFLLGFGLFGYFFHNLTNAAVSLSLLLGVAGGFVLAFALLSLLNRIFASAEGSTELDVVDRTGMLGKVSITIPERGLGEIIYTSPGGVHKSIPARGLDNHRLERDQEVVVVNYQNGVAEVDTWEHFIHEEGDFAPATPADELAQLRTLLNTSGSIQMEMLTHQEQPKE